ncbi:MAG: 50S ribosomal protein L25/general stress protein Ctc [Actinobacteria bacterium]|nr:MAG: 50S ribosomal protein L25/general stress protein Ctc [Actinomycetota bacterium]
MERKLKAEPRDGTGKGVARKLRAAGRVPAVVYGHGMEPIHVSIDSRELFHLLHTDAGMNVLVDLRIDHDQFLAMPREVQRDHIKGRFVHVDFLRIARDEKITVEVPVHLIGESHGVKEGGVIEHHLWTLQVECFPQDVPTSIEANVSRLGINEALKVLDLVAPEKCTILTSPDEVVVSVVPPQVLRVEEEEAAAAVEGEEAAAEAEGAAGEEGAGQAAEPES